MGLSLILNILFILYNFVTNFYLNKIKIIKGKKENVRKEKKKIKEVVSDLHFLKKTLPFYDPVIP